MTTQDLVRVAFGPQAETYIFDALKTEYEFEGRPRWDKDRLILWLADYRSPNGVQQTLDRLLANTTLRVRFATNVKTATFRKLALAFELPERVPIETPAAPELTAVTVPLSMLTYYLPRTAVQVGTIFSVRGARGQTTDYVVLEAKGDQVTTRPVTGVPQAHDWNVIHLDVLAQVHFSMAQLGLNDPLSIFTTDADETERLLAASQDRDGHWWGVFESENREGALQLVFKRVPPLLHWRRIEKLSEPFLVIERFDYELQTAEVGGRSAANTPWLRLILGENDRVVNEAPPMGIEDGVIYWRLYRQALVFARAWQQRGVAR